ncbi:MAG TPA: hypothetical protein VGI95_07820 [Caulobacteraceae bacterium]|jgi:hypothetical protein
MLYLVGGCARSGKSTLAGRLCSRHGVPWFPLDALKMGLHLGASGVGVHPEHDDLETADRMWPIVKGLIENLIFDGRDYLVEGVNLRPATVAAFIAETDTEVRACFLGYPDVPLQAKLAHVAGAAGQPNDWLNRMVPTYVAAYLEGCIAVSRELRDQCQALKLPFFDTGADYEGALTAAEHVLIGGEHG